MKKDIRVGLSEAYRMLNPYKMNEQDESQGLLDKVYELDDILASSDKEWDNAVEGAMTVNGVATYEDLLQVYPEAIEDLITFGRERVQEVDPEYAVDAFLEDHVRSDVQDGTETLEDADIKTLGHWIKSQFPDQYPTIEDAIAKVEDWLDAIGGGGNTYDYSQYYSAYDPIESWIEERVRSDVQDGRTPFTPEDVTNLATYLQKAKPDKFATVEEAEAKIREWMEKKGIKTLQEDPMSHLNHYIDQRKAVGYSLYPDFGAQFKPEDVAAMEKMLVDRFKFDPAKAKSTVADFIAKKNVAIREMKRLVGEQDEYNPEDDPEYIAKKQAEEEEQKALDHYVDAEEEKYMFKKHGVVDEKSKFGLPSPEEAKSLENQVEEKIASMIYDLGEDVDQITAEQFEQLVNDLQNAFEVFSTREQARYAVEVYLYKNKIPIIGEELKKNSQRTIEQQ